MRSGLPLTPDTGLLRESNPKFDVLHIISSPMGLPSEAVHMCELNLKGIRIIKLLGMSFEQYNIRQPERGAGIPN